MVFKNIYIYLIYFSILRNKKIIEIIKKWILSEVSMGLFCAPKYKLGLFLRRVLVEIISVGSSIVGIIYQLRCKRKR